MSDSDRFDASRTTDVVVRMAALAVLAVWCFTVLSPFLLAVVWGAILAIALHGPFLKLARALGDRPNVAALLLSTTLVAVIVVPSLLGAGALADDLERTGRAFQRGELEIPPPPPTVAAWPVVGARVHETWLLASQSLEAALASAGPRLQSVATWLLSAAGALLLSVLHFLLAVIVSGVMLAHSARAAEKMNAVARRLIGIRGPRFLELATATVRGVTRGILGVALIQAILSGAALFLAEVPAAGLWTLGALVLAVVQIGIAPVMIPAAIWVFANADTTIAVAFLIWTILLLPLDNVLKPILMGRGLDVPVLVIFLGAIGGFISQGIIGLFVGAVGLVLGYELLEEWLEDRPIGGEPSDATASDAA